MSVQVRYAGKQPIVVNGKTWLQDEVYLVNEKLLVALVAAYGESIVLPASATGEEIVTGAKVPAEGADGQPAGADGIDGIDGGDRTSMKVMLMQLAAPSQGAAGQMAALGIDAVGATTTEPIAAPEGAVAPVAEPTKTVAAKKKATP